MQIRKCSPLSAILLMSTVLTSLTFMQAVTANAQPADDHGTLGKMPVREVTVFKDGHALLVHEGALPVDNDGNVRMDYVPIPIMGTFWPYAAPGGPKLSAVVASPHRVQLRRTALSIQDIIEANVGAACLITETGGKKYPATIVGIPQRSVAELQSTAPAGSGDLLPVKAAVVLLKTSAGTQALPLNKIQDVTVGGKYHSQVTEQEMRNLLTLKLDWSSTQRSPTARVGMMYLQLGLRWIPSYKVSIDGKGHAAVTMQATLINDITDLHDVSVNLVIGVPTFFFQDQQDPIGLQQAIAGLSNYMFSNAPTSMAMSNGLMGQMGGFGGGMGGGGGGGFGRPGGQGGTPNPEIASSEKNEDLYLFNVKHVSLRKGQRMVLPITQFNLPYKDVYTVDLPVTPPTDARIMGNLNEQQLETMRLQNQPKAEHKIRLTNNAKFPLTTAPALILNNGRVVSQGQMTYTSVGADVDLKLTTAVGIRVKKKDRELERIPDVVVFQGSHYGRIRMEGTISVTSYQDAPVEIEITRTVLGGELSASAGGKGEMLNGTEDDDLNIKTYQNPSWWGWYSWPYWWYHFNAVGRVTWNQKIEPGKSIDLDYKWTYYWQ